MSERPLWAPWRIEYIQRPKEPGCVFCAAWDRPDADLLVERGTRCLLLMNAYPYASGHVMVAPHRHVDELDELTIEELTDIGVMAQRAIRALRQVMAPHGFNVGLNLGTAAGAGIAEHLHLHIVPRWDGDTNFMPVLSDTHVLPESLSATRTALTAALADQCNTL